MNGDSWNSSLQVCAISELVGACFKIRQGEALLWWLVWRRAPFPNSKIDTASRPGRLKVGGTAGKNACVTLRQASRRDALCNGLARTVGRGPRLPSGRRSAAQAGAAPLHEEASSPRPSPPEDPEEEREKV